MFSDLDYTYGVSYLRDCNLKAHIVMRRMSAPAPRQTCFDFSSGLPRAAYLLIRYHRSFSRFVDSGISAPDSSSACFMLASHSPVRVV